MIVTASITLLALVCAALAYEVIKLKKRVDHATALADDIQSEFWPRLKEITASLAKLETSDAHGLALIKQVSISNEATHKRIHDAIARIDRAIAAHPTKAPSCSFCDATQEEAGQLVRGRTAHICPDCFHLCANTIPETKAAQEAPTKDTQ